jgi:hypothetical protein
MRRLGIPHVVPEVHHFRSSGFVPGGVGAKIVVIIVLKIRTHFVSLVIQRDNVTTGNGRKPWR